MGDWHASLTIEPEKVGPGGKEGVMTSSWTEVTRGQRSPALEQGAERQKKIGRSAERIKSPLIRRRRVGGEQVRQDPDPGEGDVV